MPVMLFRSCASRRRSCAGPPLRQRARSFARAISFRRRREQSRWANPMRLGEEIDHSDIEVVPQNRIAYIDGYGNLKTTIRSDENHIGSGSEVRVRIGKAERTATASDGSFEVEQGQLAFAPGSSGWTDAKGIETRWMELFLRGGNACGSVRAPAGRR